MLNAALEANTKIGPSAFAAQTALRRRPVHPQAPPHAAVHNPPRWAAALPWAQATAVPGPTQQHEVDEEMPEGARAEGAAEIINRL